MYLTEIYKFVKYLLAVNNEQRVCISHVFTLGKFWVKQHLFSKKQINAIVVVNAL